MAQKLLKSGGKRKISPKKAAVDAPKRIVLVGTYAARQLEKWPGYYNYPLYGKDKIDVEAVKGVNELWLFSGAKLPRYFAAECLGVKTREELKEFGYKATGKGHGSGQYLLFKIKRLYAPSRDFAESVTIRTKDFAGQGATQKQLKAYLESPDRKDPLLAKMLPKIVTELPRERLRVCEAAVQLQFALLYPASRADNRSENQMKIISLFSGAGGLDIGFDQAGFETSVMVEFDPACCRTLRKNMPNTPVIEGDINQISTKQILEAAGLKPLEAALVIGGPPCQSFSLAGKRMGMNDPRGMLVLQFIRVVRESLPKAFVMENVRGMTNWEKGKAMDAIMTEATMPISYGGKIYTYKVSYQVLNAADFGAPQFRERVFVVGNREEKDFVFPSKQYGPPDNQEGLKPYKTVREAICELPPATPPSEVAMRVSGTIKDRIAKHGY